MREGLKDELICSDDVITVEKICVKEPCKATHGTWSQWNDWSRTCLTSIDQTSSRKRFRTCSPPNAEECENGVMFETQIASNIPYCKMESCPTYNISEFVVDTTNENHVNVRVKFKMSRAKVRNSRVRLSISNSTRSNPEIRSKP